MSRALLLVGVIGMAAACHGQILYVSDIQGRVGEYEIGTGATRVVGSLPAQGYSINQLIGITYDPQRDRILMCARHDNDVYSMDPATGVAVVLFNPAVTFQGCAVLNDVLYGVDEGSQALVGYSLTTFAVVPTSGAGLPGHIHSVGVDQAAGQLYISNSSTPGTWEIDAMGTPGTLVVAAGGTEDIEGGYGGDFIAAPYNRTITTIDGVTGASAVLIDTATLTTMGVDGSTTGVALRQTLGPAVRTVTPAVATVAPGQTGIGVVVDVENTGTDILDVTSVDLAFVDAAMMDVSADYVVLPDPLNPVEIAVGATEVFVFSVDAGTNPTLGTITVDAGIQATERTGGAMRQDSSADTPGSWDVIGAVPMVRLVDAVDSIVGQGSLGRPVQVTVENVGLVEMTVGAVSLTFTGSADRTAEYTVTPDPMNPTVIAAGTMSVFDLSVDVSITATTEPITIDGACNGTTTISGAPVTDLDSDITDAWDVVPCSAPTCGDCNGDLVVTILDALVAAQHSAGLIQLTGIDFSNCNVLGAIEPDPTAEVSILDALTLAQFAAGLPVMLICC